MRWLLMLENPWCLSSLLLLIVLLFMAAALTTWTRRSYQREVDSVARPRIHSTAATAPLEALYGLSERLTYIYRQLPPASEDAAWLERFRRELQQVIEQVFHAVSNAPEGERETLLTRLGIEVAELDRIVSERLATRLSQTTDRAALHGQLDQLQNTVLLSRR